MSDTRRNGAQQNHTRDGSSAKMAEELAMRIEADIVGLGWPIGESLGSEPSLIDRYGVSRAVFREAIRIVEHHGAARMRRGPGGGLLVTAPDLQAVQQPAMLYLDHADVSAQDLYDVRSSLEFACVRIATERLTEDGVRRLREVLEREMGDEGREVETGRSHDLHIVLAELTGNAALHLFVATLTSLTFERTGHLKYEAWELQEVHLAHGAIVEAITAGDPALAQHRMRSHLAAGLSYFHQRQATEGPDGHPPGPGAIVNR